MPLNDTYVRELRKIAGHDAVLTSHTDLSAYSYDGTTNWQSMSDAVVFPTSTEHITTDKFESTGTQRLELGFQRVNILID